MTYAVVKKLCSTQIGENKRKSASLIEDSDGNLLTKEDAISRRWKEYCDELYNYEIQKESSSIDEPVQVEDTRDEKEILSAEVEWAIKELKTERHRVQTDKIKAEQIKYGGETTVRVLHKLCNAILKTKEWSCRWTESVPTTIPKKANSRKCSDHRTISLISHASKVLQKIIQKRISPRIEEVLSESQAGFRRGRSTIEQITTVRILNKKARDAGSLIFHNLIVFCKAFDRVWHDALWHMMGKYNICEDMTTLIRNLYEKARSKVLVEDDYSEWLSPSLFNLYLERIVTDALNEFDVGVNCAGRRITELRFDDDIDLMEENEDNLQEVTRRVEDASKKFGMESKVTIAGKKGNVDGKVANVMVGGERLEQVKNFMYLEST